MNPIIKSKADRERVRKWIAKAIVAWKKAPHVDALGGQNALVVAIDFLCGPAPRTKKRSKKR